MPQIGWFEILVIVVLSILVIGPKDFPVVIKKIGNWIGKAKNYFTDFQREVTEVENAIEDEISIEKKYTNKSKDKKQDE